MDKKAEEIISEINRNKGSSSNFPGAFGYSIEETDLVIDMSKKCTKNNFQQIDVWGLAFLVEVNKAIIENNEKINSLIVRINCSKSKNIKVKYYLEALRRRLSYLNLNNFEDFILEFNYEKIKLYSEDALYVKNSNEIIREKFKKRNNEDKSGRLEKDFQKFLFGKGLNNSDRTNERLAVLGKDFYNLGNNKSFVIREFPTGVFDGTIKEDNRILATEYVDLVTLNNKKELSIIELKLNNSKLAVVSQVLNYTLFFRRYYKDLLKVLKERLDSHKYFDYNDFKNNRIVCYIINNYFHKRFEDILSFYKNNSQKYPFKIKKVLLGHYTEI